MNTFYKNTACLLLSLLAIGCTAAKEQPSPMAPITQPMSYNEPAPTYSNPGSLFNPSNGNDLYADSRARNIGDIVIVNIVESNTASNESDTSTTRENSRDLTANSFFTKKSVPLFGDIGTGVPALDLQSNSEFSGSGSTSRSNTITATVASRVVKILPDNVLQIEGIRETRVNSEKQYIAVRGFVRSRDISPENTIDSNYLADAQIEYFGSGLINDSQKPGWLSRLLDVINPF